MVTTEWHRARQRLTSPFGYGIVEIGADGMEIGEARNLAVETARANGCEWLFFLDYDVLTAPNCWKQLLYRTATHPDYDVYSGIYCVKEVPSIPLIYHGWARGPFWDWNFGEVITEGVCGVGMGCALLRLSAFDRLEKPWFKTDCLDDDEGPHGTTTEDMYFCDKLIKAGGKILVDCSPSCIAGHIDHSTGQIYALPEDCPPVVRAGLKLEEVAA